MKNPLEFFCPGLRKQVRELTASLAKVNSDKAQAITNLTKQLANSEGERRRSCEMFERAKEAHERQIQAIQRDRERLMQALTETTAYGETLGMHPDGLVSLQALEASAAMRKKTLAIANALHGAMAACTDKNAAWYQLAAAAVEMKAIKPAEGRKEIPFVHYNDNAR